MLRQSSILSLLVMVFVFANQRTTQGVESNVDRPQWLGAITLCTGESRIVRHAESLAVVYGAGFCVDDMLITSNGATLALSVSDGSSVTIAENSQLAIKESGQGLRFAVIQGEIRVVHGGKQPLELSTSESRVFLNRSIVRLKHVGNISTVQLVSGSAKLMSNKQASPSFRVGETYSLANGRVSPVDSGVNWQIVPSQVRLASAQQTSPPLTLPATPSVQTPSNNANPSTAANTSQANSEADEEERRRRLRGQTQTRGGGNGQASGGKSGTGTSFTGSSSLGLGSFSGSSGAFSSGGLFADANQQTFQGMVTPGNNFPAGSPFPGGINLVTAETNNTLTSVTLNGAEQAAIGVQNYYSVGVGPSPTGQVITDAFTATNPTPTTLRLPNFDAFTVKLDQYGVPDPSNPQSGGLNSNVPITGLVGQTPSGPSIIGTAPLLDDRAKLNGNATFALGEFGVSTDGNGGIAFAIRRSDQDRLIVKDSNGNDANDQVTPNSDVTFVDAVDPRFLPQVATVKQPTSSGSALTAQGTRYSELSPVRKAALTTIMADTLQGYSNRTGQTRFVVDGKIIDISGYKP